MATNPMQRKVRNSFLLGILVTTIIAGLAIAFLMWQLKLVKEEQQMQIESKAMVYVLGVDVKSGDVLTKDMFTLKEVSKSGIPSNATSSQEVIDSYSLEDSEGNNIYAKVENGVTSLYEKRNDKEYQIKTDENGKKYIEINNQKTNIEFKETPIVAKIAMNANTIITAEYIAKSDEKTEDDTRKQEYNTLVLPMDLTTGDYVDIRLGLPSGQDYIVVSKKAVEVPNIGEVDSSDTVWMNMSEDEILAMSNAIYDAYKIEGSKLYATKYTEPGNQKQATPTYAVNTDVLNLIDKNPNILKTAMQALYERYNANDERIKVLRKNYIDPATTVTGEEAEEMQANIQTKIQESITNSQDARKEYLNSLAGVE